MGRLELAGIDPRATPPARFWRALWALFVEYKTSFAQDTHEQVVDMWSTIAGASPTAVPDAGDERPAPPPRSVSRPPTFSPPVDPETGQPRRPTPAEREAWAIQHGMTGPNDLMGGGGRSGAAEKVGG